MRPSPDLKMPDGNWRRIFVRTAITTLIVTAVAIGCSAGAGYVMNGRVSQGDIYVALVIAIVICLPVSGFLILKLDQLSQANRRLHAYATTDALTGILSRRAFTEKVERHLAGERRVGDPAKGSLLVIDVDHFKIINDTFGHMAGDDALILIANTIQSCLRKDDLLGRLGGEEFGVFLTGAGTATATLAADRIRRAVSGQNLFLGTDPSSLSVSIGISTSEPGASFASLYRLADDRLYRAKANGRDRIEWESDSDAVTTNKSGSGAGDASRVA